MSPYDVSIRTHPKWICCHCFDNEMHFPITSMSIKWSCTRFLIANSADVWSLSQHMLPFPNHWRAPGLEVREKLVFFALASFQTHDKKQGFLWLACIQLTQFLWITPRSSRPRVDTSKNHFETWQWIYTESLRLEVFKAWWSPEASLDAKDGASGRMWTVILRWFRGHIDSYSYSRKTMKNL